MSGVRVLVSLPCPVFTNIKIPGLESITIPNSNQLSQIY
jgi:hypothetical protein